nr:uncharacterized protein LOC115262777 [Aedes albopictus]
MERIRAWLYLRMGLLGLMCISVCEAMSQKPKLFLTVKSASLPTLSLPEVDSAYLIVTDLMISPEGQPLPFLSGELDRSYFKRLQQERPGVQFLASFGGTAVPAELFAHLAEDDGRLLMFVQQLVQFATETGFNGLDISWMYPTQPDNVSYSLLLKQLRTACDKEHLVLTVTVPSNPAVIGKSYPVTDIADSAHYVILSTNEFRKLKKTSLIAPLYSINAGSSNSVDFHVNAWKMAGIPREKIVIIIQPTSLTYKLFQPKEYQLGTPVVRLKVRPFFKICHKLYSGSLEIYEERARCPYAFRELSWYSYENKQSVREKVKYVVSQYLGGIAIAYYDEDDPTNLCGDGQHPLTATVLSSLKGKEILTEPKSSGIAQRSVHNGDMDSYEDVVDLHMVDAGDSHARGTEAPFVVPETSVLPVVAAEVDSEPDRKPSVVLRQIPSRPSRPCSKCTKAPPCTTTVAPPCGCEKLREEFSHSNLLPYRFPDSGEDDDQRYIDGAGPGCGHCGDTLEPAVVLVDSDQAFAKLTKSSGKESLLFSEKSAKCSVDPDPLFTEPKPPVVIRPPPPEALYDPAKSRLGIIATCKNSNPPCNTNCGNCNGNPGGIGCCPCVQPQNPQQALLNILASGIGQTTVAPPPCPKAALLEMLSNLQNLARVNRNVETQPNENQTGSPICQYDGIIADPRDPRQYYLCRQGLPMNEENRFSCANGYIYDSANQKCVPDQAHR